LYEEETDPDVLQLFDEKNEEWVARWRQGTKEIKDRSSNIHLLAIPEETCDIKIRANKTISKI
jgi:hypothetical protein